MYKIFKYFNVFFKKCGSAGGGLFLQALEEGDVVVDDGIVHGVLDVPAFFFGQDDRGLGKLLEVVTDGGLGQIDIVVQVHTIQPVIMLLLDLTEDLQSCWIGKGLGDLFRLFRVHLRHRQSIYS